MTLLVLKDYWPWRNLWSHHLDNQITHLWRYLSLEVQSSLYSCSFFDSPHSNDFVCDFVHNKPIKPKSNLEELHFPPCRKTRFDLRHNQNVAFKVDAEWWTCSHWHISTRPINRLIITCRSGAAGTWNPDFLAVPFICMCRTLYSLLSIFFIHSVFTSLLILITIIHMLRSAYIPISLY